MDELLLDLYACPTDRSRWPQVLDRICHETHARSAVIQLLVSDGERAWSRWTIRDSASEAARLEHERHMGDDVNPRLRRSPQAVARTPIVLRDRDFFAPGDPALAELKERLAAIELGHFMSAGTLLGEHTRLALVLHRDVRDRRDFEPEDESFACTLVPHLRQAIRLAEHVEQSEEHARDMEGALNRVRCALVLCDSEARVVWANSAAERIIARGSDIRVCAERLAMPMPQETTALRRRIAQIAQNDAAAEPADRYVVLGSTGLQVMMHPVATREVLPLGSRGPQRRVLLVLSSPGEVPTLPPDLIGRVFALSPAESRVAAALFSGLTINEYAAATGVTIGTARFQLKQVLAKAQASRQADLIRQICSSVIAQALPECPRHS
jgi:DNA-binding CsgD family transcriptional regulator/PAS domain-containing protein